MGDVFDNIKKTAVTVGDKTAEVANDLVEKGRTALVRYQLKRELDTKYNDLGKLVYTLKSTEAWDEALVGEMLEQISDIITKIEELKPAGDPVCASCGAVVEPDDAFCRRCGTKIPSDDEQ